MKNNRITISESNLSNVKNKDDFFNYFQKSNPSIFSILHLDFEENLPFKAKNLE